MSEQPEEQEVKNQSKRRIEFFYNSKAEAFEEADVMEYKFSPLAAAGLARMMESGYASGSELRCLFRSQDPKGFSLTHVWFKANFPLPPHSHDSDCLYYIIAGEIRMGTRTLRAGDGFFLPAGAGYSYTPGPEGVELLEFRATSRFDIKISDGSPQFWDRLVGICETNRSLWDVQQPPVRTIEESAPLDGQA
jgi:quercetin dioxygenase-like cupin family protein